MGRIKARVAWDGGRYFEAEVLDDQRWNGFAIPYFTREVANGMVAYVNAEARAVVEAGGDASDMTTMRQPVPRAVAQDAAGVGVSMTLRHSDGTPACDPTDKLEHNREWEGLAAELGVDSRGGDDKCPGCGAEGFITTYCPTCGQDYE